jgi:hypothetical protein
MSAGDFLRESYQASYDVNQFHPIRVQEETAQMTLDVGGTTILNEGSGLTVLTSPISARVSGSKTGLGLNAALVRITWATDPPAGYQRGGIIALPLLNAAIRAVGRGATGTYLDTDIVVVGTTPERVA